ncbi:MAG: hypothetical protein GY928_18840 [Colwellia sp.]|nr:hypothetical protein [Colwellia sp.]
MTSGFHYGHTQTRPYTQEYYRIYARTFRDMLEGEHGKQYKMNSPGLDEHLSEEHRTFKLSHAANSRYGKHYPHALVFTIKGKQIPIPLQLDNRSISNKLYFVCPQCLHQRVHMYAVKSGYACRKCLKLHYACQSERLAERLSRRIRKLRKVLWGHNAPFIDDLLTSCSWWPKPKGVHQERYEREQAAIVKLEERYLYIIRPMLIAMLGADYDPFSGD